MEDHRITNKIEETTPFWNPPAEETLVVDPRGEMTPSQLVERKLASLLRSNPLPVSLVHTGRYTGR